MVCRMEAWRLDRVDQRSFFGGNRSGDFDSVSEIIPETTDAQLRARLSEILAGRDTVTVSLAKADPKTAATVESLLVQLQEATKDYR